MPGTNERDFYDEVAERLPSPQFIFLNYGYAEASSEPAEWIVPADQSQKYHLNLVKHVMSGAELDRADGAGSGFRTGRELLLLCRGTHRRNESTASIYVKPTCGSARRYIVCPTSLP